MNALQVIISFHGMQQDVTASTLCKYLALFVISLVKLVGSHTVSIPPSPENSAHGRCFPARRPASSRGAVAEVLAVTSRQKKGKVFWLFRVSMEC